MAERYVMEIQNDGSALIIDTTGKFGTERYRQDQIDIAQRRLEKKNSDEFLLQQYRQSQKKSA